MGLGLRLRRWIGQWRQTRTMPTTTRPAPDPADCGTAWGLDLTLPPAAKKQPAPRSRH